MSVPVFRHPVICCYSGTQCTQTQTYANTTTVLQLRFSCYAQVHTITSAKYIQNVEIFRCHHSYSHFQNSGSGCRLSVYAVFGGSYENTTGSGCILHNLVF